MLKFVSFSLVLLLGGLVHTAEMDLATYEELSNAIKNKNFIGGKDESTLKLLPQVIEPVRKIQGAIEENETTMSNE